MDAEERGLKDVAAPLSASAPEPASALVPPLGGPFRLVDPVQSPIVARVERIPVAEWTRLQQREPYLRWGVAVNSDASGPDVWRPSGPDDVGLIAVSRRRKSTGASSVHVIHLGSASRPDAGTDDAGTHPDTAGEMLVELAAELIPRLVVTGLTVPRALAGPVARLLPAALPGFDLGATDGHDRPDAAGIGWDWMWSTTPLPEAARARAAAAVEAAQVVPDRLDVSDPLVRAELENLLDVESPRHSANPGDPQVREWFGFRAADPDAGSPAGPLVACAAWYEAVPGVPLLASVAVGSRYRGRGLGVALMTAVTEAAFVAGCEVVTVDLYADNPIARNLYAGMGFTLEQEFASWWLDRRAGPCD